MAHIDLAHARRNMVQQQIRPWEVLDERVLTLLETLPREEFVPVAYRDLAYADYAIPIGLGQVMMEPKLEARLLQAVDVKPTDLVLEIGTGSGYLTAMLARLGRHVVSVDVHAEFTSAARVKLEAQGVNNVTLETGDASDGWAGQGPYDVIVITGSLPILPEAFQYNLSEGGRLFAVVGSGPAMEAVLITRVGENQWTHEGLFETELPALVNAPRPSRFVF